MSASWFYYYYFIIMIYYYYHHWYYDFIILSGYTLLYIYTVYYKNTMIIQFFDLNNILLFFISVCVKINSFL